MIPDLIVGYHVSLNILNLLLIGGVKQKKNWETLTRVYGISLVSGDFAGTTFIGITTGTTAPPLPSSTHGYE